MNFDQKNILYHFLNIVLSTIAAVIALIPSYLLEDKSISTCLLTFILIFFVLSFVFWKILRKYETLEAAKLHLHIISVDSFVFSIGLIFFYFIAWIYLFSIVKNFVGIMVMYFFILGIYNGLIYFFMPRILR